MKKKVFVIIILLFCTACIPSSDYFQWKKISEPSAEVHWVVLSDSEFDRICNFKTTAKPLACALRKDKVCYIYSKYEILKENAEVVKHELIHCFGYTHQKQ